MITQVISWLDKTREIALGWVLSPAVWPQFALLAAAYVAARVVAGRLLPVSAAQMTLAVRRGSVRLRAAAGDHAAAGSVDGGKNKYMSPVIVAIRKALQEAQIEMLYAPRMVHMKVSDA